LNIALKRQGKNVLEINQNEVELIYVIEQLMLKLSLPQKKGLRQGVGAVNYQGLMFGTKL
jgi:hypothetical protein